MHAHSINTHDTRTHTHAHTHTVHTHTHTRTRETYQCFEGNAFLDMQPGRLLALSL